MAKEDKEAKKPRVKRALENESKRDRFKRLASARVTAAIRKMQQIKNLATKNYEYDEMDVSKILNALASEFNAIKIAFSEQPKAKEETLFTLD